MTTDLSAIVDHVAKRDWETESITDTVRVAVLGLGSFAEQALPAIAQSEHCEATVGVSRSIENAERVAAAYDLDRAITDEEYHAGVATEAYDAVYVTTPNALHLPYVETAAENGKAVLCEKPLEASVERAERAVATCEEHGVPLMTAYRMQTEPLTRRLRDLVTGGAIGEVLQAHGAFCGHIVPENPDTENPAWRFDPDLAGGGALYDVGIYPLNTLRFVLGAEPASVTGTVTTHEQFPIDEHVSFTVGFENGVTASCRTSYGSHDDSYFEVLGTRGRVRLEPAFSVDADRTAVLETDAGRVELSAIETNDLTEEFAYFAHCVRTGTTPEPDGHDGVTDLRVMAGVYEAEDTRRRVEL